jgi:hypothetical protein
VGNVSADASSRVPPLNIVRPGDRPGEVEDLDDGAAAVLLEKHRERWASLLDRLK